MNEIQCSLDYITHREIDYHKFYQHLHGTLKMLKPLHCIYKVYCKV